MEALEQGDHRIYTDLAMVGKDDSFEEHCNPIKNETVEGNKSFTRVQEEGESIDKFVTDLKLLATTCNFGTLQDSLF